MLKLGDANHNILDFDKISSTIFFEKQFIAEVPEFVRAAAMLVALTLCFKYQW